MKDQGYDFERKAITLHAPIRNVGSHELTLRIHTEVRVSLSIKVIGEIQAGAPEEVAETKAEGENAEASEENQETVSASEEENEVPEAEAEAEAGT